MLIPVVKSVRDFCIDQGFASSSPLAERLHIAMMHPESRRDVGLTTSYVVRGTPEQWEALAIWLNTQTAIEPGDTVERKQEAAKLMRQARRITKELKRLAAHPGYRNVAVVGTDLMVLPAFRCGGGRWWPTPSQAVANSDGTTSHVDACDLQPHQETRSSRIFTCWSADGDVELASGTEAGTNETVER